MCWSKPGGNRSVNLDPFCKQPASINGCSNQPLLGKTFFAAKGSTFSGPHLKHPTKPKGFMGFSGIYRRFAKFTNEKNRETKVLKSCSNKNWPSKNLWPFPSCNLKGGYLQNFGNNEHNGVRLQPFKSTDVKKHGKIQKGLVWPENEVTGMISILISKRSAFLTWDLTHFLDNK